MPSKSLDIETLPNQDVLDTHPSVNARSARSNFSRLLDTARVDHERVIITAHGSPAAAIVPISDIRLLEQMPHMEWIDNISDAEFEKLDLNAVKKLLREGG